MKKHILVVDDDKEIVNLYRRALEYEGYQVNTATTGNQAIEIAQEFKFDIALVDMFLPDIRGDQVAKKLRKLDNSIRIIFITGFDESLKILSSLDFKDFSIFMKPIPLEELFEAVNDILYQRIQEQMIVE
jgi:DNA-binding response OmpR family regulator